MEKMDLDEIDEFHDAFDDISPGQTLYVSKTAHRHSRSASVPPSASCGSPTPCENMPRIGSVERPRLSVSAEGLCAGHEENPDDDYFWLKRTQERSESTLSPSSHQKSKEPEIRRVASCPGEFTGHLMFDPSFGDNIEVELRQNPRTANFFAEKSYLDILEDLKKSQARVLFSEKIKDPRVITTFSVLLGAEEDAFEMITPYNFEASQPNEEPMQLKERDSKLEEAGDLHRFLRDLDHFQAWLTKTQTDVAFENIPTSLSEAAKLLSQHQQIRDEIDNYTKDYNSMMEYGKNVTQDQIDYQYMFVRDRLKSLEDSWTELHQMWENRQQLLSQSHQMFLRDAKQDEIILNQQEHYLSKDETSLKERDSKLEEAGDLHRFLRDLDHFQAWLTKTQTDVAFENIPTSLSEAAKLLSQHQQIRDEIDNYTKDYNSMMEYGKNVTQDQIDSQYMFVRDRLKSLEDGWTELHQMWENRQQLLSQSHQMFLRDAKQDEIILNQQEHYLSKDETSLKERDSKLEEAGDLHRFLRDLDHFQAWLTKTQTDVASENIPTSLSEAAKLFSQHQQIRDEIDNYTKDYNSMMEYGKNVTQDQIDSQYMFVRDRLKSLEDGWTELHQMWENRQQLLSQSLNHQMFLRDAKKDEIILNQQEHYLSKDETSENKKRGPDGVSSQEEDLIKETDIIEEMKTELEKFVSITNEVSEFRKRQDEVEICLETELHYISKQLEDLKINYELINGKVDKDLTTISDNITATSKTMTDVLEIYFKWKQAANSMYVELCHVKNHYIASQKKFIIIRDQICEVKKEMETIKKNLSQFEIKMQDELAKLNEATNKGSKAFCQLM